MFDVGIRMKEGLGRMLVELGQRLRASGDEAVEVATVPQDEAELALHQAMGWDAAAEDSALVVAAGKFREQLK